MVDKKREYFEQLVSKNSKKKAAKILTIIEDGYIEEIVKFRIKDIDGSIR